MIEVEATFETSKLHFLFAKSYTLPWKYLALKCPIDLRSTIFTLVFKYI